MHTHMLPSTYVSKYVGTYQVTRSIRICTQVISDITYIHAARFDASKSSAVAGQSAEELGEWRRAWATLPLPLTLSLISRLSLPLPLPLPLTLP